MPILVFCDDTWHPARTIRAGLAPLENGGTTFDWVEDAAGWSGDLLAPYAGVILAKSNNTSSSNPLPWMTGPIQTALVSYVRRGGGLLAVHSGTAGYGEAAALRGLLGGVFDHHPAQCPVTVSAQGSHPVVEGVEPFTVQDEHYHMILDDPAAEVFLTTTSEHGQQPGGWSRREGRGRVVVLTPGHNLEVWLQPGFQKLLRNAMAWCNPAEE